MIHLGGEYVRPTPGCLIGLELRRVGSGAQMTFGRGGEAGSGGV
jgi:hypothetical protein